MATDNKKKNDKKPNAFVRFFKNAGKKTAGFFKGIVSEIKKVTWPTKKQVLSNTISVLAFCAVVGVVIWLADLGLSELMKLITQFS